MKGSLARDFNRQVAFRARQSMKDRQARHDRTTKPVAEPVPRASLVFRTMKLAGYGWGLGAVWVYRLSLRGRK
jgi:hypothetical protein